MTEGIKFKQSEDMGTSREGRGEKEKQWDERRKKVDKLEDLLGQSVDEGVKETIVAFWSNGFPTSSSCEGHLDRGLGAPWIGVEAPNEPEERYVGQKKVIEEVAEKYGITNEDVMRAHNKEAWVEAINKFFRNEETPEYKVWREENKKLRDKAWKLLGEFYKDREVPADHKLIIEGIGGGGAFRIHNGGKDYEVMAKDMADEQKQELEKNLLQYQKEMDDFTKFLKDKFFMASA